ncbi:hypothetical protein C0991_008260, partial [Blastosporella zonata]
MGSSRSWRTQMHGASDNSSVDFILPEFNMIWEDPYSSTDPSFPCHVDCISGMLAAEEHMNMINHNLNVKIIPIGPGVLVSDPVAPTTNGLES